MRAVCGLGKYHVSCLTITFGYARRFNSLSASNGERDGVRCRNKALWTASILCGNNNTTKNKSMFGTFIKELRARKRLGLREFCLEHGHDPSNWSKIEREVASPPRDEETLRKWASRISSSGFSWCGSVNCFGLPSSVRVIAGIPRTSCTSRRCRICD